MGETVKTDKAPKKSWSEGVIITIVDFLVQYGVDFIVK